MNASEKDSASMSFALHEATASNYRFKHKMYLQSLMTVHVRGPGQTSGAIGLALIFLVLFASRQKEQKRIFEQSLNYLTFFVLKQRKAASKGQIASTFCTKLVRFHSIDDLAMTK